MANTCLEQRFESTLTHCVPCAQRSLLRGEGKSAKDVVAADAREDLRSGLVGEPKGEEFCRAETFPAGRGPMNAAYAGEWWFDAECSTGSITPTRASTANNASTPMPSATCCARCWRFPWSFHNTFAVVWALELPARHPIGGLHQAPAHRSDCSAPGRSAHKATGCLSAAYGRSTFR